MLNINFQTMLMETARNQAQIPMTYQNKVTLFISFLWSQYSLTNYVRYKFRFWEQHPYEETVTGGVQGDDAIGEVSEAASEFV